MIKPFKFILVLSLILALSLVAYAEEDRTLENNQWYDGDVFYEVDDYGLIQSGPSLMILNDLVQYVGSSDDKTTALAIKGDKIFLGFYNTFFDYVPDNKGWAVYNTNTKQWTGKPTGIPETYIGSPKRFIEKKDGLYAVLSEIENGLYPKVYKTVNGVKWEAATLMPRGEFVSSWAEDEVAEALAFKLVPDPLQKNFALDINRVEFSELIVNYLEVSSKDGIDGFMKEKNLKLKANPFSDTNDLKVLYAYSLGIIKGKSETIFDPSNKINREEAAVMLYRTIKLFKNDLKTVPNIFKDDATFSSWSKESVGIISDLKIMNGKGNQTFAPKDSYTREQAYMTMDRLYKYLYK